MNYLVTGCAGFIGAKVTENLLAQGHSVVGLDSLNDYYDPKLKQHRLSKLQGPNFSFYHGSIEDQQVLDGVFKKHQFDAVINLAAMAGVRFSQRFPDLYFSTNVDGTLNLLEMMRKYGVKKKILASTSSLYAGQTLPFTEDLAVNKPLSPYAASKKSAEMICFTYHHLYDLDVSVLRFFTVYGPAGRPDMSVYRFIFAVEQGVPLTVFGDGEQARDFTFVDDIAAGVVAAIRPVGYEVINLGGGRTPISVNTLISTIEKTLNKKAIVDRKPFHKADMKETWADISKAKTLLEWQPRIQLTEGIQQSVDWFLKEKSWLLKLENKNVD